MKLNEKLIQIKNSISHKIKTPIKESRQSNITISRINTKTPCAQRPNHQLISAKRTAFRTESAADIDFTKPEIFKKEGIKNPYISKTLFRL